MIRRRTVLAASAAALAAPAILRAQAVQKLTFYYPIAVGGPLQAIMDGYCKAFEQETGLAVEPVYAGDYSQTLIKALAAIRAGTGPQFAVLLAAEMHSLQDQDILVSIDDIGLDADGKKWLGGFYPAFMANSHADGKTWSVPYQRSTAIFYYNKTAFRDAGLDPETFPTTWSDLAAAAEKLTKRDASGRVTRWGIKMAGDLGNAQWTFGALANQAEQTLMNEAGSEVYFDQPKTIEAMAFWRAPCYTRRAVELAATLARLPGGQYCDHPAHHGQPRQCAGEGAVSLWRRRSRWQALAAHSGRRRQHLLLQGRKRGRTTGQPSLRALGEQTRAGGRLVDAHRLYSHQPCRLRDQDHAGLHRQGARGKCRAHLPAGRDRRAVGA